MLNLPCCIKAKFYAKFALLLPKGSFYAQEFAENSLVYSICRQNPMCAYHEEEILCQLL